MVYIVEDDPSIAELERYALKNAGFDAVIFGDSVSFWAAMEHDAPQLVILDWMLPGESGLSILEHLRATLGNVALPVLLVTARDSELDIVKGLDAGADDFLTKPFGIMEFISRVRALMRRAALNHPAESDLSFEGITMEQASRRVSVDGKPIELTYKEYALLEMLLKSPDKVVSRERIWAEVWNSEAEVESRTLDMHIRTLRQKLGEAGGTIQTVRKVGYRMERQSHEIH